ncbi:MAG: membrane protein insertion efficiency factor YidD [Planctomycetia bacterium]|nr:membrane protein insertion efficiency factor YidD [Planctomycetia bacterium]
MRIIDPPIAMVRGYQRSISPRLHAAGVRCRFEPSCSEYCIEALERHGLFRGLVKTVWRLLRCNPHNYGSCIDHP